MGIHALAKTGQRAVIPYLRTFAESHKYYAPQVNQAIKKIEAASPAPSGLAGKLPWPVLGGGSEDVHTGGEKTLGKVRTGRSREYLGYDYSRPGGYVRNCRRR